MRARVETWCRGSGRRDVRRILVSMSASKTQLSALALPADSVPPTTVATTSHSGGTSCAARNMTGTVVSSSSSMMRGFISAT